MSLYNALISEFEKKGIKVNYVDNYFRVFLSVSINNSPYTIKVDVEEFKYCVKAFFNLSDMNLLFAISDVDKNILYCMANKFNKEFDWGRAYISNLNSEPSWTVEFPTIDGFYITPESAVQIIGAVLQSIEYFLPELIKLTSLKNI